MPRTNRDRSVCSRGVLGSAVNPAGAHWTACTLASVREDTPIFPRMFETCLPTALRLIPSSQSCGSLGIVCTHAYVIHARQPEALGQAVDRNYVLSLTGLTSMPPPPPKREFPIEMANVRDARRRGFSHDVGWSPRSAAGDALSRCRSGTSSWCCPPPNS